MRLKARKSDLLEFLQQESASLVIRLAHLLDICIAILDCLDSCVLTGRWCTHNCKLMDLRHLMCDYLRCKRIAKSPSGHRICFGETIDDNRPILHTRQR